MQLHDDPEWLFPFEFMQVGDSFFIPTLKSSNLIYLIENRAKKAKIRVKTYAVVEEDFMGVRTWRIG
jgi:hypothetical protein|tara:strand:- start:1417 stop:1617 length:201 start_codon:yes stop_codon:yes gene_type:complete